MVDVAATQTIGFALSARQALNNLARPEIQTTILSTNANRLQSITAASGPSRVALPEGLSTTRASPRVTDVSIEQARSLLSNSLTAAYQIRDALETLNDTVQLAATSSLTSSLSAVAPGGTRVSGVNIQATATRITQAIDSLVASTFSNGISLISSTSGPIRIQTTEFGGRISVSPQALDSAGLNIQNLDTVFRADAQDAKFRPDIAVANSLSRIATLETLASSLRFDTATSRSLANALSVSDGRDARGSLVNLQV